MILPDGITPTDWWRHEPEDGEPGFVLGRPTGDGEHWRVLRYEAPVGADPIPDINPVTRILGVDPGDVHVGVAQGVGETCYWAGELTPGEFLVALERWCRYGQLDVVVCESFRLYPDVAMAQAYSEFLTSQLIGVIRYLCAIHDVELVMQGADIKDPTRGILRSRKLASTAKRLGAGGHAADAELHLMHYLIKPRSPDARNSSQTWNLGQGSE